MEEIRCGSCRKLLMKAAGQAILGPVDIKCPRCGTMNCLRPAAIVPVMPASDRLERPTQGDGSCGSTSRTRPIRKTV